MKKTGPEAYCQEVLNRWVSDATRGFPNDIEARIRNEVTAHYYDAFEEYRSQGSTTLQAHDAAMAALGDAWKARLRLREAHPNQISPEYLRKSIAPVRQVWSFALFLVSTSVVLYPRLSGLSVALWVMVVSSMAVFGVSAIIAVKRFAAKGAWRVAILLDFALHSLCLGLYVSALLLSQFQGLMDGFRRVFVVLSITALLSLVMGTIWKLRNLRLTSDTRR